VLGEVLTAILTPFHADGSVDVDAFKRLANHLVDNGSDGLVVAGTTGEAPTLTDPEKLELFTAALEAVGDRATVVANTGTYDTQHSADLTGEAHDLGVHAFLAVTPYYNKPPQRAIVRHFQEIACMTDKPVLVYNIPSRVVVNVEPTTMDELAQIENVQGVKQANPDLAQAKHIVAAGLTLYAGDDNLVLPFVELGGEGGVCVHTHVWGPQTKEMIGRAKSGDLDGARRLNEEMAPAYELLKIQTNPIPIKAAMNLLGHELGGYRLPMVDPTDDELAQVRACLERAGVLEPVRA
jgi:4-hydroxy-tetrahydrodipicolinate synthase